MKSVIIFLIAVLNCLTANSQYQTEGLISENIEKNLEKTVISLCNPEFQGRKFGSQGELKASQYIFSEFKAFTDEKRLYIQPYKVEFDSLYELLIKGNGVCLSSKKDLNTWEWCFVKDIDNQELVYIGFGIDSKTYSDFRNVDIKGKWVVMDLVTPVDESGAIADTMDFEDEIDFIKLQQKKDLVREHGAAGIILRVEKSSITRMNENSTYSFNSYRPPYSLIWNSNLGTYPVIMASKEKVDSLLGTNTHELESNVLKHLKLRKPIAGTYKSHISFSISKKMNILHSRNIISVIEGKMSSNAILVSAHYDHLGMQDGSIYYGANDNASGVAVMLELAGALNKAVKEGFRPETTLIFAAFSGEEIGLMGSQHFINSEIYEKYKIVEVLNFDGIGTIDSLHLKTPGFSYAFLSNDSNGRLKERLNKANIGNDKFILEFNDPYPEDKINKRSDHYSFAMLGTPTVLFFTGIHPVSLTHYHTFYDTPEKLSYKNMSNIVRFAFQYIRNRSYVSENH